VPINDVGASSNRACTMCPTVEMGEVCPLLLGHHSSDGTAAAGHFPVAIEGYGPFLQRRIIVVLALDVSRVAPVLVHTHIHFPCQFLGSCRYIQICHPPASIGVPN
jgi:hypothetical protein